MSETLAKADGETTASGPLSSADLAEHFKVELDREDQDSAGSRVEQSQEIDGSAGANTDVQSVVSAVEAPDIAEPEAVNQREIQAPAGMSDEDRVAFAKLTPELRQWVVNSDKSRTADYTRKTQEVAESRKAYDAGLQTLQTQLQEYDRILKGFTARPVTPPDPALRHTDPLAYEDQQAEYIQAKHRMEIANEERERIRVESDRINKEMFERQVAEETKLLREKVPEFADARKAPILSKAVAEYAIGNGYTVDELKFARASDIAVLVKAMRYDAAQAASQRAQPVTVVPKSSQPGPAKSVSRGGPITTAIQTLSQAPTRENLAAAFLAQLNSERR
jgi:hypothetical protein